MCCRRGEDRRSARYPKLQPLARFPNRPSTCRSWKGKSVVKEGMEKQGMLVLHICLAIHPFEISTFPFVSFLSQTFIILFLEITCMCVGICIWVQVPTEAMGSLAVRVKGRCKALSMGAGDWAQVSIQSIQYIVFRAVHTLNGGVTTPALDFLRCNFQQNFQQRSNHFTEHFLFDDIWIETWFVWDCQMKFRTPVEV